MSRCFNPTKRYPEPHLGSLDDLFLELKSRNTGDLAEQAVRNLLRQTHGTIVDIGCAAGEVTRTLARNTTYPVVGIDVNPKAIELAKEKSGTLPNLTYICADAYNLGDSVPVAELIMLHYAMHHFELDPIATSIAQVLGPQGDVIINDFDRFTCRDVVERSCGKSLGKPAMRELQEAYKKGNVAQTITRLKLDKIPSLLTYLSMQASHTCQEVQAAFDRAGIHSYGSLHEGQGTYSIYASRKIPKSITTNKL